MPPDPGDDVVRVARVRAVHQATPLAVVATLINVLLAAIVLAPVAPRPLLLGWIGLAVLLSLARLAVRRAFLRHDPEPGPALDRFAALGTLGVGLSGGLWGFAALGLADHSQMTLLFVAFATGGMCAGAAAIHAPHLPSALAYFLAACLPLAARLLSGGNTTQLVAGLMVLVFIATLAFTAHRFHREFGERVGLQHDLAQRGRELAEANARLRAEMAERQAAEAELRQAQKMEAIGQLTGGIAHDFNNLLTVVIGNLELIRRAAGDRERVIGYADAAERAADRGARLAGGLLAFARRQSLRAEAVDANALLAEFQPILARGAGERVRLAFALAPALPACRTDPAHFQTAVLNLVLNARDAMPRDGAITIATGTASLTAADLAGNADARPGEFVAVSVRDHGVGMTPEVAARAFEPLFTTKQPGQGTGLGLSQVYGFARQSGGHVRLDTAPGAGTTVTLYLPVAPEGAAAEPPSPARETAAPDLSDITALVVDEDADLLAVMRETLGETGARVLAARDAEEAGHALRDVPELRLLIADAAMPGGVALARVARALRPEVAVILTTGQADGAPVARETDQDGFELLRKPFRRAEFLARAHAALERCGTRSGAACSC